MSTIGCGDIVPPTFWARIVFSFVVFMGIGIFATALTEDTTDFTEQEPMQMRGLHRVRMRAHAIIVGYDERRSLSASGNADGSRYRTTSSTSRNHGFAVPVLARFSQCFPFGAAWSAASSDPRRASIRDTWACVMRPSARNVPMS